MQSIEKLPLRTITPEEKQAHANSRAVFMGRLIAGGADINPDTGVLDPTFDQKQLMHREMDTELANRRKTEFLNNTEEGKRIYSHLKGWKAVTDVIMDTSPKYTQYFPAYESTEWFDKVGEQAKRKAIAEAFIYTNELPFELNESDNYDEIEQIADKAVLKLESTAQSLADKTRYTFGETVKVPRSAKGNLPPTVENGWTVETITAQGNFRVSNGEGAFKDLSIQVLDHFNNRTLQDS